MGWVEEFMFCAKKRNPELVMKNVVVIVRLCMLLAFEKTLAIYLSLFFIGLHVVINIKKNLFVQSFKKEKSPVELFMRSFYWKKRHSPILLGSLGSLISFRLLHIVKLDSKQIKQNGI